MRRASPKNTGFPQYRTATSLFDYLMMHVKVLAFTLRCHKAICIYVKNSAGRSYISSLALYLSRYRDWLRDTALKGHARIHTRYQNNFSSTTKHDIDAVADTSFHHYKSFSNCHILMPRSYLTAELLNLSYDILHYLSRRHAKVAGHRPRRI